MQIYDIDQGALSDVILNAVSRMSPHDLEAPLARAVRPAMPEDIKDAVEEQVEFLINDTHYKIAAAKYYTPATSPKNDLGKEVRHPSLHRGSAIRLRFKSGRATITR